MSRKPRRHINPTEFVRTLALQRHVWRALVDFDPVSRYYALVSSGPDHDAWLLTWLPGQGTGWHDHGESSGSYIVVQGTLTEQVATAAGAEQPPRPVEWTSRLTSNDQRTFGRRYVHRVDNLGLDPAVSLHVYTPRLTVMTTYTERDGVLKPVNTERESVHW